MPLLSAMRSTTFWGISAPYKNRATNSSTVEYLIVAGGGAGGWNTGGGGGAGGVVTGNITSTSGTTYNITVGLGGVPNSSTNGTNGGDSVFHSYTATGGGYGGAESPGIIGGNAGGSGGGAGYRGNSSQGGAGIPGQGYAGGGGSSGSYPYTNGGGGGAGGPGQNANVGGNKGGNGGAGILSSITGTYYAGGGGGGGYAAASAPAGTASNGGGAGGGGGSPAGVGGTPNTGGGGGGGAAGGAGTGGAGGSGVVILKYSEIFTITISGGFTGSTTSPSGGYKITTITAGTGTVSWSGGGGAVTIPDPALWYKNSSIASLSNGSSISTWANSGTYGAPYNLTSGSGLGAAVPTKQTDSGNAAAYFDGSKFLRFANQINIPFFPTSQFKQWTIFVVYRDGNGTGNFGFLGRYGADGVNGSIGMWPNGQGNFNQVHTNDGFPVNFAMPPDETKIQRGLRWGTPTSNDGTITYWDGAASATSQTTWGVYGSDLQVGGVGTARTSYNNGYLYELVLYERALTDTEVTTVRTYLNTTFTLGETVAAVNVNGSSVNSGTYIFNNSNSVNTITVTGTSKAVTFSLWGAAGGNGAYPSTGSSGAGGFSQGTVTLQPGVTYYLYVGQGGFGPASYSYGAGGSGGWPNGGYGTVGDASGGGGGGMTMLSTTTFNTSMSESSILLIAGGGGGSTGYAGAAGAGGGSTGQSAAGGSTGGTQSSGGTYNGTRLTGGSATGSQTGSSDDGGGGGGGYYGGGGGTSDAKPGAGGSGYANFGLVSSITLTTGSGTTAPNPNSTLNASYANGRVDVTGAPANGRQGLAYITFITQPTLPSGTLSYTVGQSFDASSGSATFYAAEGVTSIKIEISGGAGGGGGGWNATGAGGGAGGIAAGIYTLGASRIFTYYVGGGGAGGAGYAQPGRGGGASAVVIYDTFTTIAAAGGGGGGGDGWNGTAGTGGAGGSVTSTTGPAIGNGSNGTTTQSAGGGGGTSSAGTNAASSLANAVGRVGGKGGTLGGSGGGGTSGYGAGGSFSTDFYWGGGGGGGGYYGGAGGWGSSAGDGGGGGSSYLAAGISSTTASFSASSGTSGGAAGNGQYNAGTSGGSGRVKVTFI